MKVWNTLERTELRRGKVYSISLVWFMEVDQIFQWYGRHYTNTSLHILRTMHGIENILKFATEYMKKISKVADCKEDVILFACFDVNFGVFDKNWI